MNFDLYADNTTWAHTRSRTIRSKSKADITYDIGQAVHHNGNLEVLAQALV